MINMIAMIFEFVNSFFILRSWKRADDVRPYPKLDYIVGRGLAPAAQRNEIRLRRVKYCFARARYIRRGDSRIGCKFRRNL